MHKTGVRILTVVCNFQHFELMAKDGGKDLFPVVLSPTILEKSGFVENKKYALFFGNEVNGVSDEVMQKIDACIEIPQFGTKHSFNIVVSAGIVLWDFYSKLNLK